MNDKRFKNKEEDLKKRFEDLKRKVTDEEKYEEEQEQNEKGGLFSGRDINKNMGCGG